MDFICFTHINISFNPTLSKNIFTIITMLFIHILFTVLLWPHKTWFWLRRLFITNQILKFSTVALVGSSIEFKFTIAKCLNRTVASCLPILAITNIEAGCLQIISAAEWSFFILSTIIISWISTELCDQFLALTFEYIACEFNFSEARCLFKSAIIVLGEVLAES